MTEPDEIVSLKGNTIPRKISVDYISFSAHVDYSQNSEFIELVKAQQIVSTFESAVHNDIVKYDRRLIGAGAWRADGNGPSARCLASTVQEPGRGRQDPYAPQSRDTALDI
jgi:Cft2 family RNA processing exonuclease